MEVHDIERAQRKIRRHRTVPSQIETASSVQEKEVEMEEASEAAAEAPMVSDSTDLEQAMETDKDIKDERMSDSSPLKTTFEKPVKGGRDFFGGGESAW